MIRSLLLAAALSARVTVAHAGTIRSKSGVVAEVADRAASAFQCLANRLERRGIRSASWAVIGGTGPLGPACIPAGPALDINQLARNVTRPRMPHNEIALANACGPIFRAQWGWGRKWLFQLGGWAGRGHGGHYARLVHHRGHAHRGTAATTRAHHDCGDWHDVSAGLLGRRYSVRRLVRAACPVLSRGGYERDAVCATGSARCHHRLPRREPSEVAGDSRLQAPRSNSAQLLNWDFPV